MESTIKVCFRIGPFDVTAYALCLVIALAAGMLLLAAQCRRKRLKADTAFLLSLLGLPLGLVGARLLYVVCRADLYGEIGMMEALRLWHGGFALWGAMGGAALAALITARITRQPAVKLLDALSAPAALMICLSRMAEYFNGEGVGLMVEEPALQFFPLAVMNEWEEWYFAIFVAEALAALIIMIVLLVRRRPDGHDAKLFTLLFCTSSILLESLRRDQFLRLIVFVRVNQLAAALTLTAVLAAVTVRWVKRHPGAPRGGMIARWIIYMALVGACIALEFAVEKSAYMSVALCYSLMAACAAGMGVSAWRLMFPRKA